MSEVKKIATRESYGKALVELGAEHSNLVVLDADLAAATKTGMFRKAFPDRHFDCGIAEANMIAVAAGLSTMGLVPFASSFAMFAAGRDSLRRQWGFDADMVVIGHVGRFMPQKNHAFLLACFAQYHKRHANSRLLLVGGGELKEQVQRQAETLGIGGAVCMAGVRKDMRQVYSAMDIFALPSLYEGLPMVCLEAQANGLPCLMSDRVTAETAVTPEAAFLPLDHGPEPWCAAFERADRQKDRAGGVEAVRRAGRDVRQTGIQLERLYERMTAGGADR